MPSPIRKHSRLFFVLAGLVLLAPAPARAHEGWGILVDPQGRIYFTDIPGSAVWRILEHGRLEKLVTGKHSHALHMDAMGNLYGSHPHRTLPVGSIWKLTPGRKLSDVVPPTRDFPLGLQSFAMDPLGRVYSVNARNASTPLLVLLRRNSDGSVDPVAGGPVGHADGKGDSAKFVGIDGMAWGEDGALYLTDGPFVRRVSKNGEVTTPVPNSLTDASFGEDLMGLAVEHNGRILVADYSGRRIIRIGSDGSVVDVHRTGLLWAPTGVTVKDGVIYSLEHLRPPLAILGDLGFGPYLRVERIAADGRAQSLGTLWGRRTTRVAAVLLILVVGGFILRHLFRRRASKAAPILGSVDGWKNFHHGKRKRFRTPVKG